MKLETHFVRSKRSIKCYCAGYALSGDVGEMVCLGYIDYKPDLKKYVYNQRLLTRDIQAECLLSIAEKLIELNK